MPSLLQLVSLQIVMYLLIKARPQLKLKKVGNR